MCEMDINGPAVSFDLSDEAGTISVYKFVALLLLNDRDIVIVIVMPGCSKTVAHSSQFIFNNRIFKHSPGMLSDGGTTLSWY